MYLQFLLFEIVSLNEEIIRQNCMLHPNVTKTLPLDLHYKKIGFSVFFFINNRKLDFIHSNAICAQFYYKKYEPKIIKCLFKKIKVYLFSITFI